MWFINVNLNRNFIFQSYRFVTDYDNQDTNKI